ncbi:glycolate oxidase subunit GlcE [Sulfuriferula sp. AH1]|uniref:glycolate oxidase subunit GlcE n=1 Tax=Sulfuriferula sp. AH1 TaxID=1985873 RepID=UPI000B3B5691|nr:glycolate oxidase subunit GlcE [Sulfuriferula sp. AH1]ARU31090.1 glycolate oxidase subunit GlcE [Sulfuriferula sp. AH1]
MPPADLTATLKQQVQAAYACTTPLQIVGGNSKAFYGRTTRGTVLDVSGHGGIISYEPTELVITARAGTPLDDIEAALAEQGQMLPFEPPHWGPAATLGGTVACNLSGPRRPYAGSARDFVLGCHMLNGKGELLHFGGEVMKNVAGYDAARLMAGALGTLGVLLDISLKVLPAPQQELTLVQPCTLAEALMRMNRLAGQPIPLSASAWIDGQLYLRFSGAATAVAAVKAREPSEVLADAANFWRGLRELHTPFFVDAGKLWRIALPPTAAQPDLPGDWLVEWGGAQRWLKSNADVEQVRARVLASGGHATLVHGASASKAVFQPLPPVLWQLHQRLKQAFDPAGILNPGRMYEGL